MPVTHLIHPVSKKPLTFHEAPAVLDAEGIQPASAVKAVILEHIDREAAFNVRPSDVAPAFVCRRQRVWETTHDYGVNPLEAEDMLEGTAFHVVLKTDEVETPADGGRLEVCGVPMRGRIDWIDGETITDLKNKKPYWIPKFATAEEKKAGGKAGVRIWEPPNDDSEHRLQLSLYRVLREKEGKHAPKKGRVWRRYGGVKANQGRYKLFEFHLLDEAGIEREAGEWMRSLSFGLASAQVEKEAWRQMPPDGRQMVGKEGLWKCNRCPLRAECDATDKNWVAF